MGLIPPVDPRLSFSISNSAWNSSVAQRRHLRSHFFELTSIEVFALALFVPNQSITLGSAFDVHVHVHRKMVSILVFKYPT